MLHAAELAEFFVLRRAYLANPSVTAQTDISGVVVAQATRQFTLLHERKLQAVGLGLLHALVGLAVEQVADGLPSAHYADRRDDVCDDAIHISYFFANIALTPPRQKDSKRHKKAPTSYSAAWVPVCGERGRGVKHL